MYQEKFNEEKKPQPKKTTVFYFDIELCDKDNCVRKFTEEEIENSRWPNLPFDLIELGDIIIVRGDRKTRDRAYSIARSKIGKCMTRHKSIGDPTRFKVRGRQLDDEGIILLKKVKDDLYGG